MTVIHLDVETRSVVDLNKCGAHVYFAHPSTEILCVCYAVDDGPVKTWLPKRTNPLDLYEHPDATFCAHNAGFERLAWATQLEAKHRWPALPPLSQWDCTMARAQAMALPASLDGACKAAGLKIGKDQTGRRVMLQLSKPRSINDDGTPVWWEDSAKFERLKAYCAQDVEIERRLSWVVPALSAHERSIWKLDQQINGRGVAVDVETARGAIKTIESRLAKLDLKMDWLTLGVVEKCTQVSRLGRWLAAQGVETESLGKAQVAELLEGDIPEPARQALNLRQQAARSSTAKVNAILKRAEADSRVRGNLAYHAASTGRWGGRGVQMQNLPRQVISPVEPAMRVLRSGDDDNLEMLFGDPMNAVSQCIRPLIVAGPGKVLVGADYSAIEARVLAWLANQCDVIEVFRRGEDIYRYAAASIGSDDRQLGKVATLALGYGMGDKTFSTTAAGYGVVLSEERAREIKNQWREANHFIVKLWQDLNDAAMNAMRSVGKAYECDSCFLIKYAFDGISLWCQLPSGRKLCYPHASVKPRETPWGEMRDAVHYWTTDSRTKQWVETAGYGGLWAENVTQAVARDVMADAMLRVDPIMPVVLTVHDELLCEVNASFEAPVETLAKQMCVLPEWADADLILAAEGWTGQRYGK